MRFESSQLTLDTQTKSQVLLTVFSLSESAFDFTFYYIKLFRQFKIPSTSHGKWLQEKILRHIGMVNGERQQQQKKMKEKIAH